MPLYGIRVLKLVFVCSLLVSCIQIFLYRIVVLNAKYAHESRFPWEQKAIGVVSDEFSEDDIRDERPTTSPDQHQETTTTKTITNANLNPRACSLHGEMSNYQLAETPSDLSDWSFRKMLVCPRFNVKQRRKTRLKLIFVCNKVDAFPNFVRTNATDDVFQIRPEDRCLNLYIAQCCMDALPVPNIVHYAWYNKKTLSFIEFVSFISTIRFVRPCAILIHGDSLPEGEYWDLIVSMYPKIIHIKRKVPTSLFEKDVKYKEHVADAWRIKSLLRYGGIYMDTDTLLVRSIDPLRRYSYTMSKQIENKTLSSAFVMAEKNASFLHDWLQWYQIYYNNESYSYNAMMYPHMLSGQKPGNIHIEYGTVSRPKGQLGNVIFTTNTDWSNVFGMHLYIKSYLRYVEYVDENNVRSLNTTFGALCRHILFGNKELCA